MFEKVLRIAITNRGVFEWQTAPQIEEEIDIFSARTINPYPSRMSCLTAAKDKLQINSPPLEPSNLAPLERGQSIRANQYHLQLEKALPDEVARQTATITKALGNVPEYLFHLTRPCPFVLWPTTPLLVGNSARAATSDD